MTTTPVRCRRRSPNARSNRRDSARAVWWRFHPMLSAAIRTACLCAWVFVSASCLGAELETINNVRLMPTDWADGDSFLVQFPDTNEFMVS